MNLSSKRLIYIKCTAEGLSDYLKFATNEAVMKYVTFGALSHTQALERYKAALAINDQNKPLGYWMGYTKENKSLIIYLKIIDLGNGQHEVGYLVLPEHWGKGYASETTVALVEYAKTIDDIKELVGIVDSRNGASKKVLVKQGFRYYKTLFDGNGDGEYFRLNI